MTEIQLQDQQKIVQEKIIAIKQCERNLMFSAFEIGKHLSELKAQNIDLRLFVENNGFSFSYTRAMSFKILYESIEKNNLAGEIPEQEMKKIGVDKMLEMVRPLKANTAEFITGLGTDNIQQMNRHQLRQHIQRNLNRTDPNEDAIIEAEGYIQTATDKIRNHQEYLQTWSGKERIKKAAEELLSLIVQPQTPEPSPLPRSLP